MMDGPSANRATTHDAMLATTQAHNIKKFPTVGPEPIVQFLKFAVVGVLNTAVHYAVFLLLFSGVGMNYLIASALGYGVGTINSYLLNRRWTFRSGDSRIVGEMIRFGAVNVIALVANAGILFALVSTFHLDPRIAQLIAIVGSLGINFTLNKLWTFAVTT